MHSYDRYEIQEAVFVRWANSLADGTVRELSDILDTKFLSIFVKLITGDSFVSSGSRLQDIQNAFRLVDNGERFNQISMNEIADGNPRAICFAVWQLIQIFWKRFAPADVRDQKLAEALKDWCVERAQRFQVQISDFISSWRDGYALNAILLSYNPELFSMNQICDMRAVDRIEYAMSLAEHHVNTPRLLQPKDFSSERLDMKSVVCYLMVLYLSLTNKESSPQESHSSEQQQIESLESSKSSQSPMIINQKDIAISDSQSTADSGALSGETAQNEAEYSTSKSFEQFPSAPSSRRQSQQAVDVS
uniref:Calponin-homology (CH) domain-containing protein n=1 Tax=Elaeophora elaphi TaxID=1147741 RepID=A0A0R3RIC4_9BILA